jgi:hypothetical protein
MRESSIHAKAWNLLAQPVRGTIRCALAVTVLSLMFLLVAMWNGFPLIFYDTSAYVLEGLGHVFLVERAPVYAELLFLAGARFSLWPAVILQALISSYLILEVARAEVPKLSLAGLAVIGGALAVFTGIAWYVGQVEPDIFTSVVILGAYLLLFRGAGLGKTRLRWITGLTGLAVACHPSHLGLLGGLLIAAVIFKAMAARKGEAGLPRVDIRRGLIALVTALGLIVAGNFVMTGKLFISKSGSVFLFARLMQDGIVQRLMTDTCPPQGDIQWRLCAFKNRLPKSANAWLWGEGSGFHALGGFASQVQQDEDRSIVVESLKRYPILHLRAAVTDSLLQFLQFKTGDGIEPQLSITVPNFQRVIPAQLASYRQAHQQRGLIRFKILNLIHVPVGAMSVLGLVLLFQRARRDANAGVFPALVLLGLIGNAIICGTFSNPHDRYQSRIVWLPSLVLLLAFARDRRALQPVPETQS